MDKSYRLKHSIGPALRHRRLELDISEETTFEKTYLKIAAIEKSSHLRYNELIQLCKNYHWSLSQFFDEVEFLDKLRKMA